MREKIEHIGYVLLQVHPVLMVIGFIILNGEGKNFSYSQHPYLYIIRNVYQIVLSYN